MTDKKQPRGDERWGDLELRVVDDVPDAEEGQGMTPEEIQAFLDRPLGTEEEGQ
jgi:hypothetical protein